MLIFWKETLISAKLRGFLYTRVYFPNLHMCVYLRTTCQVSSIILSSFRQVILAPPGKRTQKKLTLIMVSFSNQVSARRENQFLFYNQIKSTFIISFRHLLPLLKFNIFLLQGLYNKDTPLVIENINFTMEQLSFQSST